jgi:hypothetical protein
VASFQLAVNVDVDSLMAGGMTSRDFIEFVKELDEAMGEWDFTLELAEYFEKQKAEHAREQAFDAAKAADRG